MSSGDRASNNNYFGSGNAGGNNITSSSGPGANIGGGYGAQGSFGKK